MCFSIRVSGKCLGFFTNKQLLLFPVEEKLSDTKCQAVDAKGRLVFWRHMAWIILALEAAVTEVVKLVPGWTWESFQGRKTQHVHTFSPKKVPWKSDPSMHGSFQPFKDSERHGVLETWIHCSPQHLREAGLVGVGSWCRVFRTFKLLQRLIETSLGGNELCFIWTLLISD